MPAEPLDHEPRRPTAAGARPTASTSTSRAPSPGARLSGWASYTCGARRARVLRAARTRSNTTGGTPPPRRAWRAGRSLRRCRSPGASRPASRARRCWACAWPRPRTGDRDGDGDRDGAGARARRARPAVCVIDLGGVGEPDSRAPAGVRAPRPARHLVAARGRRALAALPRRHQRAQPRERRLLEPNLAYDPDADRPRLVERAPAGHPVPAVVRRPLPFLNARPRERRRTSAPSPRRCA